MYDVTIFTFVLENMMMIGIMKKSLVSYGELRYMLKDLVKKSI